METAWLKQFSEDGTKESFSNNDNKKKETSANFLKTFLKSNPIKSVYTEKPSDARNVEPLETISGSGFDNVKGLQQPREEKNKKAREERKERKNDETATENDKKVIGEMFTTAATTLLSLYLAYNLYFNLTVGDKKIVDIEKTLDNIPMKPATNWFVEIVKNINIFITTSIPSRIKSVVDGNSYFKYRTVFVLFVVLANFVLKPAINNVIKFFEGLSKQNSKNVLKYIFNYQNNNKIISVLFFFFLTKSLYSMFLEERGSDCLFYCGEPDFIFNWTIRVCSSSLSHHSSSLDICGDVFVCFLRILQHDLFLYNRELRHKVAVRQRDLVHGTFWRDQSPHEFWTSFV